MPRVLVGDVDVAYDVHGDGEDAFVLVHGSTGGRSHWLQVAPVLAERFRVVVPEYAGGTETTDPGGPLDVDDLAAQVLAAADDAGVDRFHLAGWSLGAVVAAVVAAVAPNRVRTAALVCGWAQTDARMRFTFDLWQRLLRSDHELFARYSLADGLTAPAFEAFGEGIDGLLPMVVAGISPGAERHAELDARIDVRDRLASITAPTLVIGGTHDRWVDITHSRHLTEVITDARLEELDCGHLVPTERAAQLTALLLEHVEGR